MSPDTPLDRWGSQMPRGLRERRAISPSCRPATVALEGHGEGVVAGGAIEGPGRREAITRGEILLPSASGADASHPRRHLHIAAVSQAGGEPDGEERRPGGGGEA